jgi:hypothetical protein
MSFEMFSLQWFFAVTLTYPARFMMVAVMNP